MMQVKIHDLSSKGAGVARFENRVVFVPGVLVGETALCRPLREGKTVIEAALEKRLSDAPERVTPICPHFTKCGGCQLQHLSYEGQLLMKQKRVQDALERIGKISGIQVAPVRPSPPFGYRNKLQLPVRNGKLGFFGALSHTFVPVENCDLHLPASQKTLLAIEAMGIPSSIKTVVMKTAFSTNAILLILCGTDTISETVRQFARNVCREQPLVKGVYYTQQKPDSNFVFGQQFTLLAGEEAIEDTLLGLKFRIYKDAFYQVNPYQVPHLYQYVLDALDLQPNERILDAFCGVGTLTLLAAKQCEEAIGIECVPSAIESAVKNAQLNGITNATFHLGRAEEKIKKLLPIDAVILNPPRKGCDPEVIQALLKAKPKKLIYISCDPATLARDIQLLSLEYTLERVQPFDLFPQTVHVESVAVFKRKF